MSKSETSQAFYIFILSGWEAEDISKLTNLESNSVVFNKTLVTVRHLILPFKPSFVAISRFKTVAFELVSRGAFVRIKWFLLDIVTGIICKNVLWIEDLLKLLCWTPLVFKGMSSCNYVWCRLLQLLARHRTSDSHLFKMWPLAKQFQHSFSSSTNLFFFSLKDFDLNWSQNVILCLFSHYEHFISLSVLFFLLLILVDLMGLSLFLYGSSLANFCYWIVLFFCSIF